MILNEIIQRIQSLYSKGVQSDDTRLKSRHIYNKIVTVRSKLIEQKSDKSKSLSQWAYQTIPCVELIKAPPYECPCIPPVGCVIYRTKNKVPNILVDKKGHLIQSVTSLDGHIIFSEISWTEKQYKNGNKYTAKHPDYFFRNEYLYVTSVKPPKLIAITALFEDPIAAMNFASCCEGDSTDCSSPLDMDFPMEGTMIDTLVDMASQELIDKFNRNIEDLRNDSKNSSSEQTI